MRIKIIAKPWSDKLPEEVKDDLLGLELEVVRKQQRKQQPIFCFPGQNPSPKTTIGFIVESMTIVEVLFELGKKQSALWWCGEILPRNDFWTFEKECCEIVSN